MAIGARTVGKSAEMVTVPDTSPQLPGTPSYTEPYIGDDNHPARGTYSPDLSNETLKAQTVATKKPPVPVLTVGNPEVKDSIKGTGTVQDKPVPIDPLTGAPFGTEMQEIRPRYSPDHLVKAAMAQVGILRSVLVEIRAQNPQSACMLDGPATVTTNPQFWRFNMNRKNVIALRFLIQNNSAVAMYVGIGEPATPGGITIAANGGMLDLKGVKAETISLAMASGGAININGQSTGGVILKTWSNPEWNEMRGQA